MKIEISKNYGALSMAAAKMVANTVTSKMGRAVLALPTGETPLGMYAELIKIYKAGALDLSHVITFNLDEYVGLPPSHPQSYNYYMRTNFFNSVNIKPENIHIPDGLTAIRMLHAYCKSYEAFIEATGGLDLAILGIGGDGHIGFNEPNSPFTSRTRPVKLLEQTRRDNARFFGSLEEVPTDAITVGIGTIMTARTIMLLASGENKAKILAKAIEGPLSTEIPASFLQTHNNVIILADEAAASKLRKR